ncbi:MAG: hypothetical protein IKA96_06865 [Alistipes sp.]|nr:hypothetical protein [Alistipes sp.]MBR2399660.1 hypothetical protein [Alistipes sp.]
MRFSPTHHFCYRHHPYFTEPQTFWGWALGQAYTLPTSTKQKKDDLKSRLLCDSAEREGFDRQAKRR